MRHASEAVEKAYRLAVERYATLDVNVEAALRHLATLPISLHCWQGDDVRGFEGADSPIGGGLAVTGAHPGAARTADELRADIEKALSLIPGHHRLNLHASYAETGHTKADRDALTPGHFQNWIDWTRQKKLPRDFNPTFFNHPLANDGFTLAHADDGIRRFWIRHAQACRRIGAAFGQAQGSPCITNLWIPDGYKDSPFNRLAPRQRLLGSLDEIFAEPINPAHSLDSLEGKLFGLGSESYVAGSHEFYLGYAITRKKLLCLDAGHFHPTESIADKISSVLLYLDRILLHVSRGVRWDSDHIVTLNDDLRAIAEEVIRHDHANRIHLGLDFFDASVNRIAAWVIGTRAMLKALLLALLEPKQRLAAAEAAGDFTTRLALLEESKTLPFPAVWDYYCLANNVPIGSDWLTEIRAHERDVLSKRT